MSWTWVQTASGPDVHTGTRDADGAQLVITYDAVGVPGPVWKVAATPAEGNNPGELPTWSACTQATDILSLRRANPDANRSWLQANATAIALDALKTRVETFAGSQLPAP